MPSFTSQVPNLQVQGPWVDLQLAVPPYVNAAMQRAGTQVPPPITVRAMIDTGATGSVTSQGLTAQLGLNPIGITYINTPSSTNVQCYEFPMMFLFPNNVSIETIVIEAPLQGQHIQCLIGRNVLASAVFIYTGYTNQFTLSF